MQSTAPERKINIMIVDDAAVVRGMILRKLSEVEHFNVVASVANGELAVSSIKHNDVDVVILDIEMPVMDGMTALPLLLEASPETKIIVASTLTKRNAEISLRALEMGAVDYIPKPTSKEDKGALNEFYSELVDKILALTTKPKAKEVTPAAVVERTAEEVNAILRRAMEHIKPAVISAPSDASPIANFPGNRPAALAIAASTGGPQALMEIFQMLQNHLLDVPIFITQHMPPTFTTILAEQLTRAIGRECVEAENGMVVEAGKVYVAPGDYHMVPRIRGSEVVIQLNQDEAVNFCRPAADPMIDGLINIYGKHLMLLVLTGMGHDGFNGAKKLRKIGGSIIAQDRETCVVWGMPKAVTEHGLCKAVLPLKEIGPYVAQAFGGRS